MQKTWVRHLMLLVALCSFGLPRYIFAQQPVIRTLTEQELEDMIEGGSIQASRSSDTAQSIARLHAGLAGGKTVKLVTLDSVPESWLTVSPGGVGGGGAWQYVNDRVKAQNLPRISNGNLIAAETLSKYLGRPINAVVRSEGDGATIEAILLAADLDVPLIDACMVGRARPEIEEQVGVITGVPIDPAVYVSRFGDVVILKKAADAYRVEDISRALAVASGGGVSGVDTPMDGEAARKGLIPGSISQAILLGKTAREAVENHQDPILALLKVVHGYKLFHGVVTRDDTKGDRGFTWSDVTITGIGEDLGHTYRVYVKNENVAAWYDGVPDATAPDFFSNLDPATGDALVGPTLGAYRVGAEVVFIGWPAAPVWREPKGIEVFGPRHFGFDFDYVPIEELQKRRNNPQY